MHSRGLYSGKRNISERSVPLPFFIFLFSTNTYRGATMGFPEGSVGKESACNAGDIGDAGFGHCVGKIPWRREWRPTPVFLPEKSHGQRSLVGYNSKGCKESDVTEQLSPHIHTHML